MSYEYEEDDVEYCPNCGEVLTPDHQCPKEQKDD